MVKIKRAYEKAAPADGRRILVDRLWPRGTSKAEAHIDEWLKDLGPSTELRQWFGHDPARWSEFKQRYLRELAAPAPKALLAGIAAQAGKSTVTLVYAARDTEHNNAVVLAELLAKMLK
jgi:uncharacterized protein YeaO (DUF488 family)